METDVVLYTFTCLWASCTVTELQLTDRRPIPVPPWAASLHLACPGCGERLVFTAYRDRESSSWHHIEPDQLSTGASGG